MKAVVLSKANSLIYKIITTILSVLFFVMIVFSFSSLQEKIVADAAFLLQGEGTEQSPFLIGTSSELLELSNKVNHTETPESTTGLVFALTADIDMYGVEFESIGTADHPFAGKFTGKYDGLNHVLVNLETAGKGLFGYTAPGALIEGIGVANAQVGDNFTISEVGGIVGVNLGTVRYCFFYGTVLGINSVGGIVGVNGSESGTTGDVDSCYSSGKIIAAGTFVGGVVGKNYYRINCAYSLSQIDSGYWPGVNYNGNIGGVLGGRMSRIDGYNTTPSYSYFNKDGNYGSLKTIGYGAGSKDESAVDDSPSALDFRFSGLLSSDFETKSLTELFGTTYESRWLKNKYKATDYSAWYGPVLKNYVPSTSGFIENLYFKNSVAIRCFGYTHSQYEWGSVNNPYLIENTDHFNNLAEATQNGAKPESYLGKHFLQKENLNFEGQHPLIIGKKHEAVLPFSATYDGGGKTIDNFNLEDSIYVNQTYVGLFGYLSSSGTVKNLVLGDGCSFVGKRFVGSVVGYSQGGTLTTIRSEAKVIADTEYGGGIVGQADAGNYTNIISDVSFLGLDTLLVNKHKGVFGASSNVTITNVWYLDNPLKSAGVSSTGGQGNVMHFNPDFGGLVAELGETGQITFIASPKNGWESEYRNIDELVIYADLDNSFEPNITESRRNLDYYLRFVKEISVVLENSEGEEIPLLSYTALPLLNAKYWAGQRFSVMVDISNTVEGYYVHETTFADLDDEIIPAPDYLNYYYDNYTKKISVRTEMSKDMATMIVVVNRILLNQSAFSSPQIYTGEFVYNFNAEDDLVLGGPEGFVAEVDYYGVNPINATINGKCSIVYSKGGIIRGKLDKNYVISPKQLQVVFDASDHSIVATVKEFDGIGGVDSFGDRVFQPTLVQQDKVVGIVVADRSNLSRLEMTAEISYITSDVNPNNDISVIVRFQLRGSSSYNYVLPEQVEGQYGGITKRLIKVVIDSPLFKPFDGKSPSPPEHSYVDYRSASFPAEMKMKKSPRFFFAPVDDTVSPNAGTYTVTVDFADGSDGSLFIIKFANPSDLLGEPLDELNYLIMPRACTVSYKGFSEASYVPGVLGNIVYTPGRTMNYSVSYFDVELNEILLTCEYFQGLVPLEKNPDEAGNYKAKVQVLPESQFGLSIETEKNYYLSNAELEFNIERAVQNPLIITSVGEMDYGTVYTILSSGGSGDGETLYSVISSVGNTAEGLIDQDQLTPLKAGTIWLVAHKSQSKNYLEKESEPFQLEINKVSMMLSLVDMEIFYSSPHSLVFEFNNGDSEEPTGFIQPGILIFINAVSEKYDAEKTYNVGSYNLVMSQDAISDGYEFAYSDATVSLTVNKMPITVTSENIYVVYGSPEASLSYYVTEDIGLDVLLGAIEREEGCNVGQYAITIGTLEENNLNYQISFIPALYIISPASISLIIAAKTKSFGDPDPVPTYSVEGLVLGDTAEIIGLNGIILRSLGENAYRQGSSIPYAEYKYYTPIGEGAFSHTSLNYSSTITVITASLKIVPVVPNFYNNVRVRVKYGKALSEALYGPLLVSDMPVMAEARGRRYIVGEGRWEEQIIQGSYSWLNDRIKPSFENYPTFSAQLLFNPIDRNYIVSSFSVLVEPERLPVIINFTSDDSFTYDGLSHKNIAYSFTGIINNDDLKAIVVYDGNSDVVNAGSYKATVNIANGNYKISGINYQTIVITKKNLEIGHPNVKLPLNGTIDYKFTYDGFIKGEDESVLETLPTIVYVNIVGLQKNIKASGAISQNYSFIYSSFDVSVLAIELENSLENTTISVVGIFEEGVSCKCEIISSGLEYKNMAGKFEAAKLKFPEIASSAISTMYVVKFTDKNEQVIQESGVKTMTVTLSADEVEKFGEYKFFGVSSSGDMVLLDAPELIGNQVVFNVENLVSVMFLEPSVETFNKLYLYIGAGAVFGVLILSFAVVALIKAKKQRRIIKFKEDV